MSVSTRIEAIEQHLTDDYSVLTLAGADLTNVDKNIINLKPTWQERLLYFMNNGTDVVWNNWEKVEGTGESLSLNNTEEAPMKINLKGNTSQEGTPTPETPQDIHVVSGDNEIQVCGKNLFDKDNTNYVNGWIDGTTMRLNTINGNRMFYIPCKPNTTYTISRSVITSSFRTTTYDSTPFPTVTGSNVDYTVSSVLKNNSGTTLTITTGANAKYLVVHYGKIEDTNLNETLATIMVVKGNTAPTTYEPYQSQSYAVNLGNIELCKIGDYQDSIKKSTGKNLCNGINQNVYLNNATNQCGVASNNSGLYIQVSGGNYTISTTKTQERYRVACSNDEPSGVAQTAYRGQNKDNTSNSITIDTTGYSYLIVNATDLSTIQIEKGSSSSDFEPYGKVWYKYGAINKIVFDGSEAWNIYLKALYIDNLDTGKPNSLCSSFTNKGQDWSSVDENNRGKYTMTNESNQFKCMPLIDMTVAEFKTWLSTHNLIVYYQLITPTITEITDTTLISQLEALNGAKSYTTQTNINQVNNDKPFILDVTALKQLTQ